MKKILLSALVAILALPAFAQQANVVFFSEFGEEFTIYVNGQKQNSEPAANVRIEDVSQEFFQIRVDFKDPVNIGFQANVGAEKGSEVTYMIKKNKKGNFVARVHNSTPIGGATAVITPTPGPAPTPTGRPAEQTTTIRVEEPVQTTQTIQTTTTITDDSDEDVDFKMEVPGGSVKIKIDGGGIGMDVKESTTTTVTTTTTTSRPATETVIVEQPVVETPVQSAGCVPADQATINQMKSAISSKSFEDSKMTVAKQATRGKCLKASQVRELMGLFTFEESKLEYAKYAYDFTFDQDNYYLVNDAFTFESSIDDLNEYIEGR